MKKIKIDDILLWENDNYLLINKPPHISTLEDRSDPVNILGILRSYWQESQVCHRLDKDTSGVLAVAKHPEAYRHLSLQFEKRETKKMYHALVDGIHQFEDKLVDQPIIKTDLGFVKIGKQGKEAQTYFTSLKAYRLHTLVACRPITGRMHQIRVHLSQLEAPIAGDEVYGGKMVFLSTVKRNFKLKKFDEEQPLMKRMALHALSLDFQDINREPISIQAPYPKDFKALINQLERA